MEAKVEADLYYMGGLTVKYIIDTSVFMDCYSVIEELGTEVDIIIPMEVIEKLDVLRGSPDPSTSLLAQRAIKEIRARFNSDNVTLDITCGNRCDDAIVRAASRFVDCVVLTNDLALEIRLRGLGIKVQNYHAQSVDGLLSKTAKELLLPKESIAELFDKGCIDVGVEMGSNLYPNQYLTIKDMYGSSQSAFGRYNAMTKKIVSVRPIIKWDVKPKNREQIWAFDALSNKDIPIVILTGVAGTGKNYLSLAMAFDLTLETHDYKKIFVMRPNIPVGRDIGYLPGSKDEKVSPWLGGVLDNAEILLGGKGDFYMYVEKGVVETDALAYIRGRSLRNTFIIVDEVENMSPREVQVVLSRVAEGSKVVLLGDPMQVDNLKHNSRTCGLTYIVEQAKDTSLAAHVHLVDATVRGDVAAWAAQQSVSC